MQEKGALTAKQKRFCELMVENNHQQYKSYLEAFGCSLNTAKTQGAKLMKQDKIVNYINKLEEEALRQAGITPARIANELGKMAFAEVDNESGLTYQVKQNALKQLREQFGLDKKVIEADIKTTVIDINIEDEEE